MNSVVQQDISEFIETFALSDCLNNSTFLITGASGLIGSTLIFSLLSLNRNIRVIAPVRNKNKAIHVLGSFADKVDLFECELISFDYESIPGVDFIVHCAAPTSSKFFVDKPVETFEIIYQGTMDLLRFAQKRTVKAFVYLSSLEVYGSILNDDKYVTEDVQGYLDPIDVRSSYPMAKRAAENLCHIFAREYGVPVKIARLTQTTGAGIAKDDNRVIAQFTRLAAQNQDIVLHTTGDAARPYCYTMDCISAILYILLRGDAGEAYNVANEDTYISARDMAFFIQKNFNPSIDVKFELNENSCYAPVTKQKLSSNKLQSLGWTPRYDLNEIIRRLTQYLKA